MTVVDLRSAIVAEGLWSVANQAEIHYSEEPNRNDWVGHPAHFLPIHPDCSSAVCMWFEWAGAPRPDGQPAGSKIVGDTETFLARGQRTTLQSLQPADVIVYGYPGVIGTQHAVIVYEPGEDPWVISHGQESDPRIVRSSAEHVGQPRTYLRFPTTKTVTTPAPKPLPAPKGSPTVTQLKDSGLVLLKNVAQAQIAVKNGWALWYFAEEAHDPGPFIAQVGGKPSGEHLYAEPDYTKKKAA